MCALYTKNPEMLPAWADAGKYTAEFLEWLFDDGCGVLEINGEALIKARQKEFRFLYYSRKFPSDPYLAVNEGLEFAGLFHIPDYALYDVSNQLKNMIGIPKDIKFLGKDIVKENAEKRISTWICRYLEANWDKVLHSKKYEASKIIPKIDQQVVRETAEGFFLDGKQEEQVEYVPQFSFGHIKNEFTDECYLLYLMAPDKVVQSFALRWIKSHVKYVFQQKIIFGCVKEELREIYANPKDRMHKIRRLRQVLDGDYKMVQVSMVKKGISMTFKIPAENLKMRNGKYRISNIPLKERQKFKSVFGHHEDLCIEDIRQVTHGHRTLYESMKQEPKSEAV